MTDPSKLVFELDHWDRATSADRLASAHAVAASLPKSFSLVGLERHALGGQTHELALYEYAGCRFTLLPGRNSAVLGYDRSRPYQATAAQAADWQLVHDEYGWTLNEYLDHYLTPLRRSEFLPLLLEVVARPFSYAQDGANQTEGYNRVLAKCGQDFRLPTPDEWEYACAGGTRSLFRWGDECPITNSYTDKTFEQHKRANAFGLILNASTYETEICAGPTLRGGDGGGSVCGGIGELITWLPLASSFAVSEDEIQGWWIDEVFMRRARSIIIE